MDGCMKYRGQNIQSGEENLFEHKLRKLNVQHIIIWSIKLLNKTKMDTVKINLESTLQWTQ